MGRSYDYWIIKIDSLGNKQWDKDFGGIDNEEFCKIFSNLDRGLFTFRDFLFSNKWR